MRNSKICIIKVKNCLIILNKHIQKFMKLLLTLALILTIGFANAQSDTSYWTNGGQFALNGSQTSFTNWAAGGENQISIKASAQLFANYLKGNTAWDNLLLADLGTSRQGKQDYRKGDDKIEFNTKYGRKASDKWFYTALFNFKSQFTNGYEYVNDTTKITLSNFLAPAYFKLGLGMDYKPNKNLSVFLSPATVKWTLVNDQALADAGKFGLEPAIRDTAGNIVAHANKIRTEAGALIRVTYKKDIWENVNFASILELYSNYLKNPQNVDVDWQFVFTFKVNKYLNAQINGHLIYDDDVNINYDSNGDGILNANGPKTQFNEALSLGLVYKL